MTVEVQSTKTRFTFDGVALTQDFPWKYFNSTDVIVQRVSNGSIVNADYYSVTASASGEGGTVTFDSGQLVEDEEYLIYRELEYSQGSTIPAVGRLPYLTVENALDKSMMVVQQVKEITDRCVKAPISVDLSDFDPTLPSTFTAKKALIINDDGDGLVLSDDDYNDQLADVTAQADAAANSAAAAAVSAAAALAAETNAETAETNAEAWATQLVTAVDGGEYSSKENAIGDNVPTGSAKRWASEDEDTLVDGVEYSAKHYAAKAAESASLFEAASVTEQLAGTENAKQSTPDSVAALWEKGTDIASDTQAEIPATGGGYFDVTGTTTIVRLNQATAAKIGRLVRLQFDGILTLTHAADQLILPAGSNITTAAGDVAEFVCEGVTLNDQIWRCVKYTRADGTPLAYRAATSSVAGIIELADQTEMEAGSATNRAVTPEGVKWHPGVMKSWSTFNGTGTVALIASYNCSSITDHGTGEYSHNVTTGFSAGTTVAGFVNAGRGAAGNQHRLFYGPQTSAISTSAYRIGVLTNSAGTFSFTDAEVVQVGLMGDQ